jgi:hypothetical protein
VSELLETRSTEEENNLTPSGGKPRLRVEAGAHDPCRATTRTPSTAMGQNGPTSVKSRCTAGSGVNDSIANDVKETARPAAIAPSCEEGCDKTLRDRVTPTWRRYASGCTRSRQAVPHFGNDILPVSKRDSGHSRRARDEGSHRAIPSIYTCRGRGSDGFCATQTTDSNAFGVGR